MKFHKKIVLGLAFATSSLFAWGDLGHQTVAQIAEKNLKDYTRVFIHSILGTTPLAAPAIFPDTVRSDARFRAFAPFHFLEIPTGSTFQNRIKKLDAHSIIHAKNLLKASYLSQEYKALFLRYLIHVVGDVHQPLHVGNGHDMGANLCAVTWIDPQSGKPEPQNLHTIWDENLIDYIKHVEYPLYLKKKNLRNNKRKGGELLPSKRWFGYKEFAEMIFDESPLTHIEKEKIAKATPETWYAESQELHSQVVYPNESGKPLHPSKRLYCLTTDPTTKARENNQIEKSRVPTLDSKYAMNATPFLKRQILKGGLRLAEILNTVAAGEKVQALEPKFFLNDLIHQIEKEN